MEPIVY